MSISMAIWVLKSATSSSVGNYLFPCPECSQTIPEEQKNGPSTILRFYMSGRIHSILQEFLFRAFLGWINRIRQPLFYCPIFICWTSIPVSAGLSINHSTFLQTLCCVSLNISDYSSYPLFSRRYACIRGLIKRFADWSLHFGTQWILRRIFIHAF